MHTQRRDLNQGQDKKSLDSGSAGLEFQGRADERTHSKPVISGQSKRRSKLVFKTDYCLMQVKSIAECSKGSILQYFRPSLSYSLLFRSLLCLFLSDCLTGSDFDVILHVVKPHCIGGKQELS